MAFTMKGAFLHAVIEKGEETYDLSTINSLASSLASARYSRLSGGMSTVELAFTPPLKEAIQLIESGILGVGFISSGSGGSLGISMINGVAVNVGASPFAGAGLAAAAGAFAVNVTKVFEGKGGSAGGPPVSDSMATVLRFQWWYEDFGQNSKSPMFFGILQPPQVSFGEEISLTIVASGGSARNAATVDRAGSFTGVSVDVIAEQIAKELGIDIVWRGSSKSIAAKRTFRGQRDVNTLLFLNERLESVGCFVYFGDDGSGTKEKMIIDSHFDVNSSKPVCELVMYKQIDPTGNIPIYPMATVDTDISHAFLQGISRGSTSITVNSNTKEVTLNRNDVDSDKRKMLGPTVGGKTQAGTTKASGISNAMPSVENEDAGMRNMGMNQNTDNDNSFEDSQEIVNDAIDKAWKVVIGGPAIPWLNPGMLVRIDIAGAKSLQVNMLVFSINESIGENGADTSLTLHSSIGPNSVEEYSLSKNTESVSEIAQGTQPSSSSLIGGVLG